LEYPPHRTSGELLYDAQRKRARYTVFNGLNAGRTYFRRFDLKEEYMVTGGDLPDCVREYLAEPMPDAVLP